MLKFDAWYFPEGETHLPTRMARRRARVDGRLTYQYHLYVRSLAAGTQRRVAVDVGAHVGLFSFWMVRDFLQVVAIEPVAAHRACWQVNVPARPQDVLHACALGAEARFVSMRTLKPGSSGGTVVEGEGDIPQRTLDSFELPVIDFLKIDCEGAEIDILRGGADTIDRCRPVCLVEQRPAQVARAGHEPAAAVAWLTARGATVAWTDQRDYVLTWARP